MLVKIAMLVYVCITIQIPVYYIILRAKFPASLNIANTHINLVNITTIR